MAGLTITVGGADITAYVDVHSISIEEVGTEIVATCRFRVRDHGGSVDISTKDVVDIDDDGTTIFAGEVAQVDDGQEGVAQTLLVTCHDNNILLDETVIAGESYTAGTADSAILADLFSTYRSDINATTHVATLDASMEAVAFAGMTLREILGDLASRTGARYYVDYSKNLHWFATEANNAAFSLSTSPNFSTSFPFGGFGRVRSAARIAEKVYVLGKEVSGWYPSGAPSYDGSARHAVSRDQRITTVQGAEDRGKAIYDQYNSERVTYRLWTERDGLRAGQSVTVVNATWSINSAFYIRRVRVEFVGADGETRRYHLELNDEGPDPGRVRRQQQLQAARLETEINSVGDTIFDTDAPAAPTALGAGNITTGVTEDADGKQLVWAEITWSEVSDSDLDHYELQISTAADFSSDLATRQHQGGGDRRERFTGLVGNTLHYVRVRAADWVGNTSAWDYGGGSPYSFTSSKDGTPPAQVAGLSAASSRTLAGLSWTASGAADLRHYEIQRAPGSAGSPGAWATLAYAQLNFYIDQDFSDAQIAALDTFWYRVRAIDTSGNPGDWATQTDVALGQIDSDHIAASAITADKIAANAITAVKIVANAVTADKILAGAVTATKINVSTLSAISADMGLLTAGEIRVGTGTVGANFTGFRIMSTYLGGYNNDVLQFYLQASDGSAMFGAGGGRLDASGLGFVDGAGTANSIVWNETNFAGDIIGAIYADVVSDDSVLWLTADTETEGGNAIIIINAAPVDVFRTGLGVRLNVNSNGTINASRCTDFLIHDGTRNWVDLVSGGDLTFDIATAGSFEIANAGVGIIVAHFDGDGGANILNGLSVGTAVVDYRSLSCDGTIRTEEGNKWNLGGVNTGTITPDRKIAVEIDGQFYTLAAQLGLV